MIFIISFVLLVSLVAALVVRPAICRFRAMTSELHVLQIAWLEADQFSKILRGQGDLLIFHSASGRAPQYHQYVTEYKGQKLGTRSPKPIDTGEHEVIGVKVIHGPESFQRKLRL